MQGVIAKKIGMSRVFLPNGDAVAVTYLKIEPNTVVRQKTAQKDGYNAVVLGIGAKSWKSRKGKQNVRYLKQKEWKVEALDALTPGSTLDAKVLPAETVVTITGTSKGKGFQGVIKRHKFKSGPSGHGSHHHREPGSVGMREWPGRVNKGKRMPGRMGTDTVTVCSRSVLSCDPAEGMVAVKGPVPGSNGSIVFLTVEQWPEGFDIASVLAAKVQEVKNEKRETSEKVAKEEKEKKETEEAVSPSPESPIPNPA